MPEKSSSPLVGTGLLKPDAPRLTVGLATCGRAAGAQEVFDELEHCLKGTATHPLVVGCLGLCYAEPLVELTLPEGDSFLLGSMTRSSARILADWLLRGQPLEALSELSEHILSRECLEAQERRVLAHAGLIDPLSLDEYLALGGYDALRMALSARSPEELTQTVVDAGLRGRGGAGFPAGKKWAACAASPQKERYCIVNGDEGDPGAYMDRALLESDPHLVLEGLIIACYAIGAKQAYIFIRAEYPLAVATVSHALETAREAGFIGNNILGSDFSLEVSIVRGAGAFLCGEGTAMVNVLENKICVPRRRPPHLAEYGLWGKPTCVNNVETFANVPLITLRGAKWFRSIGTESSPGTKIFSVVGAVARGGLIEVALGSPLSAITDDIALAQNPKAVQIGGPSGVILPLTLKDLEVSFEGLAHVDGMMGSGGIVVISEGQCVVDTASYLIAFSAEQSCKRCRVCREGLKESAELLQSLTRGEAGTEALESIENWAHLSKKQALCGHGRTAFNPLISSLRFFADEYQAHVQGRCPSRVCQALISYEIIQERCRGERCCLLSCPGNAIKGRYGKPGSILARLCQKCGMCITTCPYSAVRKVSPPAAQQ